MLKIKIIVRLPYRRLERKLIKIGQSSHNTLLASIRQMRVSGGGRKGRGGRGGEGVTGRGGTIPEITMRYVSRYLSHDTIRITILR